MIGNTATSKNNKPKKGNHAFKIARKENTVKHTFNEIVLKQLVN